MPAKQTPQCMAPALPVFACKPAPTGTAQAWAAVKILWSGFTREWPRGSRCHDRHNRLRRLPA
ncbi:hypothetical protein E6B08_18435 [Pseudomonas putida]|uniref:Uncharacterized protein n=1 Tax=Pseudomonas putida TaxID=303 RepID=A0A4D6XBS9_PSEPU|nr:hypothetical protein E6B08_18435 [Pseudomonas putida]